MKGHIPLFKIVVVGEAGVGKTSLLGTFSSKAFCEKYRATIGVDFMTKEVEVGGKQISLQIWDTAGQERYQSLGGAFYKGSHCCVIVFDLTLQRSFQEVFKWRNKFFEFSNTNQPQSFPLVIIGNKCDLMEQRKVTQEHLKRLSQLGKNVVYFEASAKDSTNVQEAFNKVAELVLSNESNQPKLQIKTVIVNKKEGSKKGCC